ISYSSALSRRVSTIDLAVSRAVVVRGATARGGTQKQINGGKRQDTALVDHLRLPVTRNSEIRAFNYTRSAKRKRIAKVQARSIFWAAFAVLLPFDAASAQATNPTTVQKIALAAVRTNVWGVADLEPDCSVAGPMIVKIR